MKSDIKIVSDGILQTEIFINGNKLDGALITGVKFEQRAGCIPLLQIEYLSNPEEKSKAPIMYPQWYVDELAKELKEAFQYIQNREETIRDRDSHIDSLKGLQKANTERINELVEDLRIANSQRR